MGEPVIINDGSPVKISWFGKHGWTPDETGLSLTRDGGLKLEWMLFNLFDKVDVAGPLKLRVNFKLKSQKAGQTLLITTDDNRQNLRLEIASPSKGMDFSDFFAPPRGAKDHKLQTPEDASITGIQYQIGSGPVQKGRTLKALPTTIFLYLD